MQEESLLFTKQYMALQVRLEVSIVRMCSAKIALWAAKDVRPETTSQVT
jgi:hypothetical protein